MMWAIYGIVVGIIFILSLCVLEGIYFYEIKYGDDDETFDSFIACFAVPFCCIIGSALWPLAIALIVLGIITSPLWGITWGVVTYFGKKKLKKDVNKAKQVETEKILSELDLGKIPT